MTNTFYTSDTHFGHFNIIGYSGRPWTTVEEMNQGLIDNWNAIVQPGDTVHHLGDVALGWKKIWPVEFLNGNIILYAGNHDDSWEGSKRFSEEMVDKYLEAGFSKVVTSGIKYDHKLSDGRRVTLSHLPYFTDGYREFPGYRPTNYGEINICGHVHEKWKIQERAVNVGVDVWSWYPVLEQALIDTINTIAA